jgi:hypothetical protein
MGLRGVSMIWCEALPWAPGGWVYSAVVCVASQRGSAPPIFSNKKKHEVLGHQLMQLPAGVQLWCLPSPTDQASTPVYVIAETFGYKGQCAANCQLSHQASKTPQQSTCCSNLPNCPPKTGNNVQGDASNHCMPANGPFHNVQSVDTTSLQGNLQLPLFPDQDHTILQ